MFKYFWRVRIFRWPDVMMFKTSGCKYQQREAENLLDLLVNSHILSSNVSVRGLWLCSSWTDYSELDSKRTLERTWPSNLCWSVIRSHDHSMIYTVYVYGRNVMTYKNNKKELLWNVILNLTHQAVLLLSLDPYRGKKKNHPTYARVFLCVRILPARLLAKCVRHLCIYHILSTSPFQNLTNSVLSTCNSSYYCNLFATRSIS